MDETGAFVRVYRAIIATYRLAPEISALQLEKILRRADPKPASPGPPKQGRGAHERRERP